MNKLTLPNATARTNVILRRTSGKTPKHKMKTNHQTKPSALTNALSGLSLYLLLALCVWVAPQAAHAANQTWTNAPVSGAWPTAGNWVGGAAPGDINNNTANTVNNDVATFNSPTLGGIGSATTPIIPDDATVSGRSRRIGGITFDTTNCGAYVIFSPSAPVVQDGTAIGTGILYVSHTNAIRINDSVTNSQVIAIPLQVDLPSSTPGIYNFVNNSTNPGVTLTINSVTHHGATTRATTYILDGTNTLNNTITNMSEGPGNGTGGFTKQGPGTWIIAGPSTFPINSPLNIIQGLLAVEDPAAFGVSSNAIVTNATLRIDNGVNLQTATITLRTGGVVLMNGSATVNGIIMATLPATSGTLATVNPTNVMLIGNTINKLTGGAIDTVLHISGPGTVQFSQTANYAGSISVDTGTNQIITQGALGVGPNLNLNAGAVFDMTPMGATVYTLDTKAFSANGTSTAVGSTASTISADPAGTMDFGSRPINLSFAPALFNGDTGHPAVFCSSGTLAFHGNAITVNNITGIPLGVGTYQLVHQATGSISSSGAFVALMAGNGLQAGLIAEITAVGGDLSLVVSAYTPKSLVWIGNDPLLPGSWDRQISTNWLNGITPTTFNIYDSATFNATGSAHPIVTLAGVMQPTSVTVDTGANNYTFTGTPGVGQIAGATGLVKINTSGTLILGTANTYSGGTIISNGIVQLAIDEGISSTGPTGANDVSLLSPGTFDLDGFSNTFNGFNGSGTVDITSGGTSTLNFGFNGDNGLFTGVIKNTSGTLGIVKEGLGLETLTSSNSYVGPTIVNGGTLRISNSLAIGAGNSPLTINVGNLDMDTNLIVTNLNGAGGGIVNSSTLTNILTVQNGGAYAGIISGKIGLFINAGTLRLNGANTYSNGTIIAAGAGLAIGSGASDPGPGLVIASNNVTISQPNTASASSTFTPSITNVDGATVTYTSATTANTWGNQFLGTSLSTNIFSGGAMSISGAMSFSNFPSTVLITNGEVRWFNAASGGDNTTFVFEGANAGCFARDNVDIIHLGALIGNGEITAPSVTAPATYWIGAKGLDSEYSGSIVGSNNVVKVGGGKLTLDGDLVTIASTDNLTFTNLQHASALTNLSTTTVSNGVLAVVAPSDLEGSSSIIVANPTAILDVTGIGYVTNFMVDSTNAASAVITTGVMTVMAAAEQDLIPQVLGGNGAVKGNGVINNGTINPGFAGQGGTLTLSNQLTVNAGATNFFDLSDDPTGVTTASDILNVGGSVTLSGSSIIGLNALNGFIAPGKVR